MRNYLAVAALLSYTEAQAAPTAADWRSLCERLAHSAQMTMEERQKGTSMAKMMEAAGGDELIESMVVDAYEKPRYHTDSHKNFEVTDFRDRWYAKCIKASKKK